MNIDELAAASQREFTALRKEMASKDDVQTILHAIEGIDLKMSSYASRWTEDFSKLHDWVVEIDSRLKFLEKTNKN
jgi:hypothetical protein